MTGEVLEVKDGDDVRRLLLRIKEHGDAKALRKELLRGLNRATKELRRDMQDAAPRMLPKAGGLAAMKERVRFSTSTSSSSKSPGVRIRTKDKTLASADERGTIRHPVFSSGKGAAWVDQTAGVTRGVLDHEFEQRAEPVRSELLRVMSEIAHKVE